MSALTHPTFAAQRAASMADTSAGEVPADDVPAGECSPGGVACSEAASPFYRVSVKALVFSVDLRLLVVQEAAGHWELPGGGWEHGETLEHCLARELHEELDVRLASVDLSTQRAWAGPGARRRYHRLKLTVHATLDSPVITPREEILSARWVTPDEFLALGINTSDRDLRDYILAIWPGQSAQS